MKLKVQIGLSHTPDGATAPDIKLTPLDQLIDLNPSVASVIHVLVGMIDRSDARPSDGALEVDIPETVVDQLVRQFPAIAALTPQTGTYELFLRLEDVA